MKTYLSVFALMGVGLMALGTAQAAPSAGDTKTCVDRILKRCQGDHSDPEGTKWYETRVFGSRTKSVQWIGTARVCKTPSTSGGDSCTTKFTHTSSVATSWKLGAKVSFTPKVGGVSSFTAEANGEFGRTTTDSDALEETREIPLGYTETPYTYIWRNKTIRQYKGVWKRGEIYWCVIPFGSRCYNYVWQPNMVALEVTYNRAESGGQLFDFKRHANGTSSGLTLEND
jgi:hypothetical protein